VAGTSARAIWALSGSTPTTPAELVTDRTRPPPLIITRNDAAGGERTLVDGVPVTSPARTAFDAGRRPGFQTAVIRSMP